MTARLLTAEPEVIAPGAVYIPGWLSIDEQRELLAKCRQWEQDAGGGTKPVMPSGAVMSVDLTCLGWHWYPYGYRRAVAAGQEVGAFPVELGELAEAALRDAGVIDEAVLAYTDRAEAGELIYAADCALINHYDDEARWACTRTAMRSAAHRWCRLAWVIRLSSASETMLTADGPGGTWSWSRETWLYSAGPAGSATTA